MIKPLSMDVIESLPRIKCPPSCTHLHLPGDVGAEVWSFGRRAGQGLIQGGYDAPAMAEDQTPGDQVPPGGWGGSDPPIPVLEALIAAKVMG